MSGALKQPYPPDDPRPVSTFEELLDAVVDDVDWSNEVVPGFSARRVELRRARLTGMQLVEGAILDTVFSDCRIDLASFRLMKLERVVFQDCRMGECDFYGATLKDVLFERCDLREATFAGATSVRVELRACELTGLHGVEALRGARMPLTDVLANGPLFAAALEIEMLDE